MQILQIFPIWTWALAYAVICGASVWRIYGIFEQRGFHEENRSAVKIGAGKTVSVPSERIVVSALSCALLPLGLFLGTVAAGVAILAAPFLISAWCQKTRKAYHEVLPLLFPRAEERPYGGTLLHRIAERLEAPALPLLIFLLEFLGPQSLLFHENGIYAAFGFLLWATSCTVRLPELKKTLRIRRTFLRLRRDPEFLKSELQTASTAVRARVVVPNQLRNEPPDPRDEELLEAYAAEIARCRDMRNPDVP